MTVRQKIIALGALSALIAVIIFIPLRTGVMEKNYIKSLVADTHEIAGALEKYEKEKSIENKNLRKFCETVSKEYPDLSVIDIANKNDRLMEGKRGSFPARVWEDIRERFINDELEIKGDKGYLIRYFEGKRYYIFIRKFNQGRILTVFPYRLSKKMVVQLFLEIFLVVIIFMLATALIYLRQKKKEAPYNSVHYKIISRLKKEKSVNKDNEKIKQKISDSASDHFNDYVYDLFLHISSKYSSSDISLFLSNKRTGKLDKMYEFNKKTFIKADGKGISSMDIDNEIGDELKKSSIFVQERGKKITFPIIYRKSLLGVITITRENAFSGPEINAVKSHLFLTARPIGQYLQFG